MREDIIVLKFGSSVLRAPEDFPNAVHEIYRWYRCGLRVVAVVSAIGETTDQLHAQARTLSARPEIFATAELLAMGERISAALLSIALDRAGVPARVLDPRDLGFTVQGSTLDSAPEALDRQRLLGLLEAWAVLILPGFFGTDSAARTHLLGRGGSDLAAVFIAHALDARRCRLVKDVEGVYAADPALARELRPRRFIASTDANASRVAGQLIQPKALAFLQQHGRCAEVAALAAPYESLLHIRATDPFQSSPRPPCRVVLLGLGRVGFGIYQRVLANPEHFSLIGALVRSRAKYEARGGRTSLLYTNADDLRRLKPDIVVDALPGIEPSRQLIEQYLTNGAAVISANKKMVAQYGSHLTAVARKYATTLRYSAAVGGSTPMLERISAVAPGALASIAGLLNGTCNFVLDRCAEGVPLDEASAQAKRQGLADDDVTDDLCGRDAERKLCILVRDGFGEEPQHIEVATLDDTIACKARNAAGNGMKMRQVARAWRENRGVVGTIQFERVPTNAAFGRLNHEWNTLELSMVDGRKELIAGRGAGRWPTTEAVMADLFDIRRDRLRKI